MVLSQTPNRERSKHPSLRSLTLSKSSKIKPSSTHAGPNGVVERECYLTWPGVLYQAKSRIRIHASFDCPSSILYMPLPLFHKPFARDF